MDWLHIIAGQLRARVRPLALLYGTSATDPWTYGAVILLIVSSG